MITEGIIIVEAFGDELGRVQVTGEELTHVDLVRHHVFEIAGQEYNDANLVLESNGNQDSLVELNQANLEKAIATGHGTIRIVPLHTEDHLPTAEDVNDAPGIAQAIETSSDSSDSDGNGNGSFRKKFQLPEPVESLATFKTFFHDDAEYNEFVRFMTSKSKRTSLDMYRIFEIESSAMNTMDPRDIAWTIVYLGARKPKRLQKKGLGRFAFILQSAKQRIRENGGFRGGRGGRGAFRGRGGFGMGPRGQMGYGRPPPPPGQMGYGGPPPPPGQMGYGGPPPPPGQMGYGGPPPPPGQMGYGGPPPPPPPGQMGHGGPPPPPGHVGFGGPPPPPPRPGGPNSPPQTGGLVYDPHAVAVPPPYYGPIDGQRRPRVDHGPGVRRGGGGVGAVRAVAMHNQLGTGPTPRPGGKVRGQNKTLSNNKKKVRLVNHVTIPDKTQIRAGETFEKHWIVRNDSTEPWPAGATLTQVSGDSFSTPQTMCYMPNPLQPGQAGNIKIGPLKVPTMNGVYKCEWRLRDADGNKFGQRIWCEIISI